MKKQSVTIGIPAFNEENNIGLLLDNLISQKFRNLKLDRILVYSDGSTDKTNLIVLSKKNTKIVLAIGKKRKGIAYGLNYIKKRTDSNILVYLDADISIKNKYFIEKLCLPLIKNEADLTAVAINEITPSNFIEKGLFVSMKFKEVLFNLFKGGDNVYTCHGQVRGLSKKLYKQIFFPLSVGNDMYSYLFCKANGYKYRYLSNLKATYKLPDNFKDHKKQSVRFFKAINEQKSYFGEEFIRKEFHIPVSVYLLSLFKSISIVVRNPLNFSYYLLILAITKTESFFTKRINGKWMISKSSKKLKRNLSYGK